MQGHHGMPDVVRIYQVHRVGCPPAPQRRFTFLDGHTWIEYPSAAEAREQALDMGYSVAPGVWRIYE